MILKTPCAMSAIRHFTVFVERTNSFGERKCRVVDQILYAISTAARMSLDLNRAKDAQHIPEQ